MRRRKYQECGSCLEVKDKEQAAKGFQCDSCEQEVLVVFLQNSE